MAVLGDSVAWGQGLAGAFEGHKYAYQVASKFGQPPAVALCMQAHSGAVLGTEQGGIVGVSPEVPEALPTIMTQVDNVPDPTNVDLVLLNGGINDVSIYTILDPLTEPAALQRATVNACYLGTKTLLARAASVFSKPSCQFILTGYYPILSSDSDVLSLPVDDPLGHFLGVFGLGVPQHIPLEDHDVILNSIVKLSLQFWHDSDQWLGQAASETSQSLGLGERLQFVKTTFSEENSLFASSPWLFGFGPNMEPEDEVVGERASACALQYGGPLELVPREICNFASIGHPNIAGAAAIAGAIERALVIS